MSESALEEQEPVERGTCIKCGSRNATRDDQLCDSCRFMKTIKNLIASRKR